ncbi:hypothetical protein P7K49_036476 [Saguinus oedipus]|uniref:Uncharacterized protein n=1 Tax=Saguinus oedipus TaxID=9490 RepID=A0ABQ9TKH9_SAGOE|nr:hypothetical protein P7K49_036476 [Saguinus oedipus]
MTQPLREAGGHLHKGLPGKAQAAYPTDGGGSSSGPVSTVYPRRQEVILDKCKGVSFISSMAFHIPSTRHLLTRQAHTAQAHYPYGHFHYGDPWMIQERHAGNTGSSRPGSRDTPRTPVPPRTHPQQLHQCAPALPDQGDSLLRGAQQGPGARTSRTEGRACLRSDTEGDQENAEDNEEIHMERLHLKTNKHNGDKSKEDKEDRAEAPQMPGHSHKEN